MEENNNLQNLEEKDAALSKKEERARRKADKKAQRKAKKKEKKAAYKALPFWKKLLRVIIKLTIIVLVLYGLRSAAAFYIKENVEAIQQSAIEKAFETELTDELRNDFAPLDPEGAAEIEALPVYSEDETWGVYVYICGSNLESSLINEMSSVTEYLTNAEAAEIEMLQKQKKADYISAFMEEIRSQGMDLPDFMYLPEQHEPKQESQDSQHYGLLSAEINHMSSVELPDNVNVVIQAGGSKRWSHPMLNPNRSRRLLLNSEGLKIVEDNPICNVGDGEVLADFLRFCEDNYSADHKVLIIFNHGGASFGACWDEIYGDDNLSLEEMNRALASVYNANEKEPPIELIGFHACLMSSVEVTNAFRGYAKYMVSSEEVLIDTCHADRQSFWLTQFTKSPATNGALIAMEAVDGYIDFWTKLSQISLFGLKPFDGLNVTMNVIDLTKAGKVYDTYCDLMETALRDAVKDPATLTTLARAADSSIRFSGSSYRVYNTIDLGLFMDALADAYPRQCAKISKAIDSSVLYNRASGTHKQTSGLSVYFPLDISGLNGINFFLQYVNDICKDDATRALYYYKLAGCLNDQFQSYVEGKGYGTAKPLDTTALKNIDYNKLSLKSDGNFSIELTADALSLVQNVSYCLAGYSEEENRVYYYGEANLADLNGIELSTGFDGKWLCMNGQLLATEVINANIFAERYKTMISINGENYNLMLAKDKESNEIVITSICKDGDDSALDNVGHGSVQLTVGDKIKPVYKYNSLAKNDNSNVYITEYGKPFRYSDNCKIELCSVPDGSYLVFATLTDIRGDEYYSGIVQLELKDGKVESSRIREDMLNTR